MQWWAIWPGFLCLKPLSLTKSSCTCLTGTPDTSSPSSVAIHFHMSSFLSLSNDFPCWEENEKKKILETALWGGLWIPDCSIANYDVPVGKHLKYLRAFEYQQVLRISSSSACCDVLDAPKGHAVSVLRPNFEEPHYAACYLIGGDSGHKQISAAASDVSVS